MIEIRRKLVSIIESVKVFLAVKIAWRSKDILLQSLSRFQATEADGVWHLLRVAERTSDPKMKAVIFGHVLEEHSHADTFVKLYQKIGNRTFRSSPYERRDLYPLSEPLWKPLTYVHLGEEDATQRFRLICQQLPTGLFKEGLEKIVEDEEGHVGLTHSLMKKMGASDHEIVKEIIKIRLRALYERWLRTGRSVVNRIAVVLLSVVYYSIGLFLFPFAKAKMERRGGSYDGNLVKTGGKILSEVQL